MDEIVERSELRVDGPRLWRRIEALGEIGRIDGADGARGNARLALTDADRAGRDLIVEWMRELGLEVTIDRIGNIVGTRPGTDPRAAAVMTGSHVDTVATGGRFDGALGVLAGLEVVETLERADVATRRPLQVAVFTDEEGSRFPPDMLGSLVFAGGMALETALDIVSVDDGRPVGDELRRIGYSGPAPCPPPVHPGAFVELHIEQGPVLERSGSTIGIVTGVQGISWTEVTIVGRSAHAGTTPMQLRRDAGYAAATVATFVRDLTRRIGPPQVATVGRLELMPNLVNVVASRAVLAVDLRHTDDARLAEAERLLDAHLDELREHEDVEIETRRLSRFAPVEFDPGMIDRIATTADDLGYRNERLPSGAGHDAQMLARVCPSGMIFVPSVDGLSHNIAEYTAPADVEAGANVLLHVLLRSLQG